ncbi:hypothetical protein EYF80_022840 [Liparis tanakae]|uniref:Uncharacterized protein n=1 Tax=Liparis tanakae TaxID=230148 RepID=A0A4Z2HPK7_9TELE|nr:hypothetical protein EYF80_022840 [Liparis tanakae]
MRTRRRGRGSRATHACERVDIDSGRFLRRKSIEEEVDIFWGTHPLLFNIRVDDSVDEKIDRPRIITMET